MRIYNPTPPPGKKIRVQFGNKESLVFVDTTVMAVYNMIEKIFVNVEITVNPLVKPSLTNNSMTISVYPEINGKPDKGKGKTKSRTLYWLTPEEAKNIMIAYFEANP